MYDFFLLAGGPRMTFVVGTPEPTLYVGEQPLTLEQLEELWTRAQEFDFENGSNNLEDPA